jgi:hypothetical protein
MRKENGKVCYGCENGDNDRMASEESERKNGFSIALFTHDAHKSVATSACSSLLPLDSRVESDGAGESVTSARGGAGGGGGEDAEEGRVSTPEVGATGGDSTVGWVRGEAEEAVTTLASATAPR